jgi:hypothetical protein
VTVAAFVVSSLLPLLAVPVTAEATVTSALAPTTVGNYDQWGVTGTASKVTAVTAHDSDTTYISEITLGERQSFVFAGAGVPATALINSVTLYAVAREATPQSEIKLLAENGLAAGNRSVDSGHNLSSSYETYSRTMTTNPFTAAAWTAAEVNAWTVRFGVQQDDNDDFSRVTRLYLVVDYATPEIQIDTVNGADPASYSCANPTNTLSITLAGSGASEAPPGNISQYKVQIDWGDATVTNDLGTFTPSSGQGPFSYTYTGGHTYTTQGTYTIKARLYHQGAPGNDNQADAVASIVVCVTPPPTLGGLLVKKVLVNDNGGTQATTTFSFTIPGVNAGNPIAFEADGQNDFTLTAGAYTVTEVAAPGYATTYSGCSATVTAGATTTCTITNNDIAPTLTVIKQVTNNNGGAKGVSDFALFIDGTPVTSGVPRTVVPGAHTVSETPDSGYAATITGHCAANGTVSLALGEQKTCTIVNDDIGPKLTVTKVVQNDNGGTKVVADFTLLLDSVVQIFSGVQNTLNSGTYIVGEQSLAGYVGTISGDCNPTTGAITLALGDIKNCTITNADVAPTLTLQKVVVGGPNTAGEWTLAATGPTPISGTTPVASDATFSAGSYSLSETPGGLVSPYYVASAWSCTGTGSQVGSTIALDPGETATCTITNTYTPPVCDDDVDNDGDGFIDFPADIGCASTDDTSEGNENTYPTCTDESDNDGDELVDLDDPDCDAFVPTLTVVKNLLNDSNTGGTKTYTDFSFQVNGGAPIAFDADGSVTVPMPVGAYSVTEVTVAGYTTTYSATCEGTLAADEDQTCTITNDDIATTITVVKELWNNSGKSSATTTFSFSVNENEPVFFDADGSVTLFVVPGEVYSIVETSAPGYATSYDYDGGESCTGIELALGESVQCTIVNDDIPACSDGLDNDGDGVSDDEDPGCYVEDGEGSTYDPNKEDEGNESTLPLCTDESDNDGDELIDLDDPDCEAFLPTITVKKIVVNDNGGTGTFASFFFQVNGGEETNFDTETGEKTVTVPAGVYTVTEVSAPGYTTTYEGCTDIELGADDSATCTITNNDVPPPPPSGECNDKIDNEGDTRIDAEDPQCYTNGVYNPGNSEAAPSGGGVPGGGIIGGGGGGQVLGASTGQVLGISCGVYMDRYVRLGKRNSVEQVRKLQEFLNKYQNAGLPVTGFYGPLSNAAVMAFQKTHATSVLAPWGLSTPTGIVYRTTLRQINMIECPDIAEGLPELIEWSKAIDAKKPE